jgi:hypothetical protein
LTLLERGLILNSQITYQRPGDYAPGIEREPPDFLNLKTGASPMAITKSAFRCLLFAFAIAAVTLLPGVARGADPYGTPPKGLHGLRIWLSNDGVWHFVPHTDNPHVFTGTIHVSGAKITGATGVETFEKGDYWRINGATNSVTFKLTTSGKSDRIKMILTKRAKELTLNIREDGQAKPDRIHIGRGGEHPEGIPFTLPGK